MEYRPNQKVFILSVMGSLFWTAILAVPIVLGYILDVPLLILAITLVLAIIWLLHLPWRWFYLKSQRYVVKDKEIVIFKGVFTKTESNIPFGKITDFKLTEGILERWLGIGTVWIQTAGQGTAGYEGLMEGLEEPKSVHKTLTSMISKESKDHNKPELRDEVSLLIEISKKLDVIVSHLEKSDL